MKPKGFRYVCENSVGRITFCRPKTRNSLTFEIYAELRDLFAWLDSDAASRVIVLSGEGQSFCSGGDFHEIIKPLLGVKPSQLLKFCTLTCNVIRNMLRVRKPVIAQLHGATTGAGAVLAIASDIRIAAPDTRIAFLFNRVGLSGADMGAAYLLPRIIGLGLASELLLTGRFVEAEEAGRIGLVNRVVPADRLATEVDALAAELVQGPRAGQAVTKQMIRNELNTTPENALRLEATVQAKLMEGPDFREAYRAFSEKRRPEFNRSS
jgi:enoyl-CoA hydratase/carnithine racemase